MKKFRIYKVSQIETLDGFKFSLAHYTLILFACQLNTKPTNG